MEFVDNWRNAVTNGDSTAIVKAGEALAADYEKAVGRLRAEADLAVRLRARLEEVAGSEVASEVV